MKLTNALVLRTGYLATPDDKIPRGGAGAAIHHLEPTPDDKIPRGGGRSHPPSGAAAVLEKGSDDTPGTIWASGTLWCDALAG